MVSRGRAGRWQHSRIAFHRGSRQHQCMTKLFIFAGTTIGGYVGWALGDFLGFGFVWNFVLSGVGSVAGVYYGWKFAQKLDR